MEELASENFRLFVEVIPSLFILQRPIFLHESLMVILVAQVAEELNLVVEVEVLEVFVL